jgi:DNA-binding CsgD family transcriptional regulator
VIKPLSEKQIEILHWVAEGKTDWEIGQIMDINYRKISNYLRKIYRKLKVVNRTQAAAKAVRLGIIK